MAVAKDIATAEWNKIIDAMVADGWEIKDVYDGMDAGIDYNCIKIEKAEEEVVFEWFYIDEGQIKCSIERLKQIEKLTGQSFKMIETSKEDDPKHDASKRNKPPGST